MRNLQWSFLTAVFLYFVSLYSFFMVTTSNNLRSDKEQNEKCITPPLSEGMTKKLHHSMRKKAKKEISSSIIVHKKCC